MTRPAVRSRSDPPVLKREIMYRFYSENADFKKSPVIITDNHEIHHIKDVLRLKKGSLIQIFNAKSQQADVIIEQINEAAIHVRVQGVKQNEEGKKRK